ncbi:hypothetical protein [Streptomyces sp. bgisy022]|uniref:hypothetical protein n=1 Tax=Streptomyces sp. bgisy022 TaxID=3413769 RepID=UPI003D705EF3
MDILIPFLACVVIIGAAGIQSRIARTERRLARVERKLDLMLDHFGLQQELPRRDEITALLREGKKIQAVKVYREATGADLREAKEAVDRLA